MFDLPKWVMVLKPSALSGSGGVPPLLIRHGRNDGSRRRPTREWIGDGRFSRWGYHWCRLLGFCFFFEELAFEILDNCLLFRAI